MKTPRAGKDLACALMIRKVWKLAMGLKLIVITSCVQVVNKSNIQSKTPSIVTPPRDNIFFAEGRR
jgi:hypothetical protein